MIGDTNYGELAFRGNTVAALDSEDPTPAAREPIVGIDGSTIIVKVGDGVRPWSELPALGGGGGGAYIEFTGPTPPSGQADGTIAYSLDPAV